MSKLLIQRYLNDLSDLRRVSGSQRESVVREAFKTLLKDWGKSEGLLFIPEYEHTTAMEERRYVDGAVVEPQLRLPMGYWEAKDTSDDLDAEIAKKFRRGYPQDNIIFEDTQTAVLIQNTHEVLRCAVDDPELIERLVERFFKFEPEVIKEFRKAVEQFREDLPAVLETLRKAIAEAEGKNAAFKMAAIKFLKHAQDTINPSVTAADVREMLIQHILTEEIFSQVFDNSDFHRRNNVAKELYALEETFFTGGVKRETIERLRPYYSAIKRAATSVASHQEKQKFLKVIYENFYKVYNKKAADRLGVAYTPNEIVRFMIESADWLCQKHFGKQLIDKNVEILDPATGTGTFIVDLLEHFRGQPAKLKHKYLEELHANEVAILPYYVANLNIEATYAAITGEYLEYPNLCFVDTLDNVAGLRSHGIGKGQHYGDLLGGVSAENVQRVKRQNARKISIIIGNPPYNANQASDNQNNRNREYPEIDQRIKETYLAASQAQWTKLYDMYARFFRWASDRIEDNGIIAFVTNRSFVESRTFDGFRKVVADEFNHIYVVDLGGDVRSDPRLSGTRHNVFGIQTGVAISFLVRTSKPSRKNIQYARRPQLEDSTEKLQFLNSSNLQSLDLETLTPDSRYDWLDISATDFDTLLPLATHETKASSVRSLERAVFKFFTLGVNSGRDDWLFAYAREDVERRVKFLIDVYGQELRKFRDTLDQEKIDREVSQQIKWTTELRRSLQNKREITYSKDRIVPASYRPFTTKYYYFGKNLNKRLFRIPEAQPSGTEDNIYVLIPAVGITGRVKFCTFATNRLPDLNYFSPDPAHAMPRFTYDTNGIRLDNITDWALEQFRDHYAKAASSKRPITKDAIFHYVYGVLHNSEYRQKYAQNLKREFPRMPFYADFWKWSEWGEKLMILHVGYEAVKPWKLERVNIVDKTAKKSGIAPKAILKALKEAGTILLDGETQLTGVPLQAWDYKLGNRSALEWVLDQHKEKTLKDPTIREKFNTYRFADYKEHVIDLLKRVTRVSVETMAIIDEMKATKDAR